MLNRCPHGVTSTMYSAPCTLAGKRGGVCQTMRLRVGVYVVGQLIFLFLCSTRHTTCPAGQGRRMAGLTRQLVVLLICVRLNSMCLAGVQARQLAAVARRQGCMRRQCYVMRVANGWCRLTCDVLVVVVTICRAAVCQPFSVSYVRWQSVSTAACVDLSTYSAL